MFSDNFVLKQFQPFVYPRLSSMNDLYISLFFEFWQLFSRRRGCFSVWFTSSEGGSKMNESHLSVARSHFVTQTYSIWKLRGHLLTTCHFFQFLIDSITTQRQFYLTRLHFASTSDQKKCWSFIRTHARKNCDACTAPRTVGWITIHMYPLLTPLSAFEWKLKERKSRHVGMIEMKRNVFSDMKRILLA